MGIPEHPARLNCCDESQTHGTRRRIHMQEPYKPHQGLSDDINHNIAERELQGGVYLKDLPPFCVLSGRTHNRTYTLTHHPYEPETWFISGHPEYCPEPTKCFVHGSTWGGSCIKIGFIGRGMHLEF